MRAAAAQLAHTQSLNSRRREGGWKKEKKRKEKKYFGDFLKFIYLFSGAFRRVPLLSRSVLDGRAELSSEVASPVRLRVRHTASGLKRLLLG